MWQGSPEKARERYCEPGGREKAKELHKHIQLEKAKERYWNRGGHEKAQHRRNWTSCEKATELQKGAAGEVSGLDVEVWLNSLGCCLVCNDLGTATPVLAKFGCLPSAASEAAARHSA